MNGYAKKIISLFVGHRFSKKTTARFYDWLTDGNHAEEKEEALRELFDKTLLQAEEPDLDRALAEWRLRSGIPYTGIRSRLRSGILSTHIRRRLPRWLWPSAASVLLLLSLSLGAALLRMAKDEPDLVQAHMPYSQIKSLTLPDGTEVRLNSGSTLLYPEKFGRKGRSVFLIGEAGFKVQPDAKRPFVVKTDGFQVTALGTEFDVSAYPDGKAVSAVLLGGSVLVEFDNLSKSRILRPGEQLVFNKDDRGLQLKVPDIEDVTAWKRGELVFRQMTISDIITVLERRFDVTFVYRLHDFSTDRYSFRFREDASLEEVMEVITDVTGILKFRIEDDKCRITRK